MENSIWRSNKCLIFHYGQPKVAKILLYTNCWATFTSEETVKMNPGAKFVRACAR